METLLTPSYATQAETYDPERAAELFVEGSTDIGITVSRPECLAVVSPRVCMDSSVLWVSRWVANDALYKPRVFKFGKLYIGKQTECQSRFQCLAGVPLGSDFYI